MEVSEFEKICSRGWVGITEDIIDENKKQIKAFQNAIEFLENGGDKFKLYDFDLVKYYLPSKSRWESVSVSRAIEVFREKIVSREGTIASGAREMERFLKEFRAEFSVIEVHDFQRPSGGEVGKDGIADITLKETGSGKVIRMRVRDAFDVGVWADAVFSDAADPELEKRASGWLLKWGPFRGIRM